MIAKSSYNFHDSCMQDDIPEILDESIHIIVDISVEYGVAPVWN
jgi:hypothetical protein